MKKLNKLFILLLLVPTLAFATDIPLNAPSQTLGAHARDGDVTCDSEKPVKSLNIMAWSTRGSDYAYDDDERAPSDIGLGAAINIPLLQGEHIPDCSAVIQLGREKLKLENEQLRQQIAQMKAHTFTTK